MRLWNLLQQSVGFSFDPCSNTLYYFSYPAQCLFNYEKIMAGSSLGRKHSVKISLPMLA